MGLVTAVVQADLLDLGTKKDFKDKDMQPAGLLCYIMAVFVYSVNAAAGNDAATDLAGFLPGIQYVYSYSSSADVYQDVSLTVTAKVSS